MCGNGNASSPSRNFSSGLTSGPAPCTSSSTLNPAPSPPGEGWSAVQVLLVACILKTRFEAWHGAWLNVAAVALPLHELKSKYLKGWLYRGTMIGLVMHGARSGMMVGTSPGPRAFKKGIWRVQVYNPQQYNTFHALVHSFTQIRKRTLQH